ncbi:MAG: tetratricopeptide (TPR) repeat protein, partial [Rhodothermales bacterium]
MPDRRLATAAAPLVLLGALGWGAPVVADEEWTRSMASARTALLGGELGEARRWIDAASRRSQNFGDADWRRADTLEIAGALAIARGELATASKVLAEAADAYTALFGDDSAPLVLNGVERGRVALADGDIDRAEKSFNAAIVLAKSLPTGGGRGVAGAHLGLADIA